jgi:hypothetical protein
MSEKWTSQMSSCPYVLSKIFVPISDLASIHHKFCRDIAVFGIALANLLTQSAFHIIKSIFHKFYFRKFSLDFTSQKRENKKNHEVLIVCCNRFIRFC